MLPFLFKAWTIKDYCIFSAPKPSSGGGGGRQDLMSQIRQGNVSVFVNAYMSCGCYVNDRESYILSMSGEYPK